MKKSLIGKVSKVYIDTALVHKGQVLKRFIRDSWKEEKGYRGSATQCYQREKECLERLEGNIHFPQMTSYDDNKLEFKMSYCGEQFPYDKKPRTKLLPQVWEISEALEEADIKLYGYNLQSKNIMLHDDIIKIIDFEYALPENSKYEYEDRFYKHIRESWDPSIFENRMKILLVNGILMTKRNRNKYEEELKKANDMVKNEWNNYQKSNEGNSAKWRIDNLDLRQYAGTNKTLLDLGANHGEFGVELQNDFKHITAVEPFVESPKLPDNMKWVKKGFKDFIAENENIFDVVFSFAMTIQVRDVDKLNEDEIALGHYNLVKPGGIMIYETQKLESRPLNQSHVDKMLKAFRDRFGFEYKSGNARTSGKRQYYVFKRR